MRRICRIENEKVCFCCCKKKLFYRLVILSIVLFDICLILFITLMVLIKAFDPETTSAEFAKMLKT